MGLKSNKNVHKSNSKSSGITCKFYVLLLGPALAPDGGHLLAQGGVHQQVQPGEEVAVGGGQRRGHTTLPLHRLEDGAGLGHVQGLLLHTERAGERGAHLRQLLGDVGGGDVEGGGGGAVRLAVRLVGGAGAEHAALPAVVPLLGLEPAQLPRPRPRPRPRPQLRLAAVQHLVVGLLGLLAAAAVSVGAVHGDALHVLVVPPRPRHAAPRPQLGVVGRGGGGLGALAAAPADGEAAGVVALPPDDLGQDPPPRVDEPVAHLTQGQ